LLANQTFASVGHENFVLLKSLLKFIVGVSGKAKKKMNFNRDNHIREIDKAFEELFNLQDRTKAPASIQNQFIGTVIDNTLCLITGPGNSLDKGKRHVVYDKPENWISAMQAVHRSFYASVHLAIERGLIEYCEQRSVTVESSVKKEYEKKYEKIKNKLTAETQPLVTNLFEKMTKGISPNFYDYLNSALENSTIENKNKIGWRKIFDGLTIIRNKSSHSDPSLSENEIQRLKEGGYDALVSTENQLQLNPRNYYQIVVPILDFFDDLTNT